MNEVNERQQEQAYLLDTESCARYKLAPEGSAIGRSNSNNVFLKGNNLVSRQHAAIRKVGDAWIIEDLNSRHGTMVNGRRITGPHRLLSGDEVWFSTTPSLFLIADDRQFCGASINVPCPVTR